MPSSDKRKRGKAVYNILLIIGYVLAVPPLFIIRSSLKNPQKRWPWLLAELVGASLITLGWLGNEKYIGAAINGTWAVIFSGLWWRFARKKS